ncbi:hypothetical protein Q5H93_14865 [Hymenobacter sp. ASUV-10]|uniref:DUF4129 domain-containing protein n=1 Tax=Hymenobacter aranciens TaxID=3063996 RepID=A0ABT9BEE1_9BACT|nr:hypothetical protein [Hymenobacter sp. ASUV-10]MDO7876023.1 hypothetical protein [Hymenobacter sp. ASUV-10]
MHRTVLLAAPVLAALLAQLAPYYPQLVGMRRRTVPGWTRLGSAEQLTSRALLAVPAWVLQQLPAPLWEQYERLRLPAAPGSSWEQRLARLQEAEQLLGQLAELPVAE